MIRSPSSFLVLALWLGCAADPSDSRVGGGASGGQQATTTGSSETSGKKEDVVAAKAGSTGATGGTSSVGGKSGVIGNGGAPAGTTSNSGGKTGSGGASATGGAGAGSSANAGVCGSRGSAPCPKGQFCDYAAGSNCGADDSGGKCRAKPDFCTDEYDPVCGCDGKTYGNACAASSAGVSVANAGKCTSSSASNDCDQRKVLCKMMTPVCADGQVPSVSGSCYGDCVPIQSCACSQAEQCPDSSQYTCLLSAGHCGPYV